MLRERVLADAVLYHVVWQLAPRQRTSHRKGPPAVQTNWSEGSVVPWYVEAWYVEQSFRLSLTLSPILLLCIDVLCILLRGASFCRTFTLSHSTPDQQVEWSASQTPINQTYTISVVPSLLRQDHPTVNYKPVLCVYLTSVLFSGVQFQL